MTDAAIETVWTADGLDSADMFEEAIREDAEARSNPGAVVAAIYSVGLELGLAIAAQDPDAGRTILAWAQAKRGGGGFDAALVARYIQATR